MFAAYTGNKYCTPVTFFVLVISENHVLAKIHFFHSSKIVMFSSKVGRRRRCHNCRRPCCPHCTRCCRLCRCCCRQRRSCRRRYRRGRPDRSLSFVFVCRRSSVVVGVVVVIVGVVVDVLIGRCRSSSCAAVRPLSSLSPSSLSSASLSPVSSSRRC